MTAPVIQQSGEKIAMTAPVTQQSANRKWKVRFVMPSAYTLSTLPTPRSEEVKLKEIPTTRYAAIRFSGTAGPESLKKKTQALEQFIERQHFTPLEASTYAFYNPPWTLPFLRRNEVLIKIQ